MVRPLLNLLTFVAIASSAASPAFANDGTFGGEGASLTPLKETELRMVSEDILIERIEPKRDKPSIYWKIQANYVFENPTDSKKTVTMGFPEALGSVGAMCEGEGECDPMNVTRRFTFRDMETRVDGRWVKVRIGKVGEKSEWSQSLGRVHLFDVTIPAKKRITVRHDYGMGFSGTGMYDEWANYITKTGALWNGPIEKARFTIRLPSRPWGFVYPASFNLTSYETVKRGRGHVTDIVFEMKNWTPTQDLSVMFGSPYLPYHGCPSITEVVGWDVNLPGPSQPTEDILKQLRGLPAAQLRVCRNLPYARHGYIFKDSKLNALFYPEGDPSRPRTQVTKRQWPYIEMASDRREDARVVTFAPSQTYSPKMLTKAEKRWVKLIKKIEKEKK